MVSEGSDAGRPTFRRRLPQLPVLAFGLAVLLDVVGRFLDAGISAEIAAWLARLALSAFAILLIASVVLPGGRRPGIRWVPVTLGLLLGALAAWVRGHPAIPPDIPVIGANVLVLVLLLWAVRQPRSA